MKHFKETQRFDQKWLLILMAVVLLVTLIPIFLILQEETTSSSALIASSVGFFTILLVSLFLYLLKLETGIDHHGIHYRFYPVIRQKTIPWNEISECYVRKYSPLKEYGGWGIRWGFNGRAYNVKGNKGIQVVLKSGKKILFGTQKENEAKNVIQSYKENFS
ncbi:MAG: hypothetical protein WDZ45_01135 [Flavobacteriaceae bacterium]